MPLHPTSVAFLEAIKELGGPSWPELPPTRSREIFESYRDRFGFKVEMHQVDELATDSGIPLRLYRPTAEAKSAVLYFHGGGWVIGNLNTHDALCRQLAHDSESIVIAVDYRLAPENPYPAAIDDVVDSFRFCSANAGNLGIDDKRLAVAGDSAGGNLAAAICLRARDADWQETIAAQVLIYPVIARDMATPSYQDYAEGHLLTRDTMLWFWQQYLGTTDIEQANCPYADLRGHDLKNLPPAFIATAEYDVLRSEGQQYAARLRQAGVPTEARCYDGMLHAFIHNSRVFEDGLRASREIGQWLQQALSS
ncbi:MAG: alpha/beta hydrolase [Planctomycetota bacterium]|nr:alpha/beta hydrolase [Planctomycetota bacterium]